MEAVVRFFPWVTETETLHIPFFIERSETPETRHTCRDDVRTTSLIFPPFATLKPAFFATTEADNDALTFIEVRLAVTDVGTVA